MFQSRVAWQEATFSPARGTPHRMSAPSGRIRSEAGRQGKLVARGYREATVLCVEVANMATLAGTVPPEELVGLLDGLFVTFDAVARRHGLASVSVPGEAYSAVVGVPVPRKDHARVAAEAALEILAALGRLTAGRAHVPAIRIGIHSGPVAAAIDPERQSIHELWGDTARVARLMEARALPGCIQVSAATVTHLAGEYLLESRGPARGLGIESYFLVGRRGGGLEG